jgi:hypothetical protein
MLASVGHIDEALTKLKAIRPLLADAFGAESTRYTTSISRSVG